MTMDEFPRPYVPVMDEREWAAIEAFVLRAIDDAESRTPYKRRELLSAASHFVRWAHLVGGTPLERGKIFNRRRIDRYCINGLERLSEAGRSNVRSQLLRIAEALLEPGQFHPRLRPIKPSDPSSPYRWPEIVQLWEWTTIQGTDERNENAAVLIALGLGAGLSGGEIGELQVRDIVVDQFGVLVRVTGNRARTVPVLRRWDQPLRDRAAGDKDAWAFRPRRKSNFPNVITSFVRKGYTTRTDVQSQRLRSTWLVHHLEMGTPVVPLMTAAGIQSLEALTRYTKFVARPLPREERRLLSGAD